MRPKIFINLNGGIIQQILSDSPVEVIIADYDVEGLDDDRVTSFKDESGKDTEEAVISHQHAGSGDRDEIAIVEALFKNILEATNGNG